MAPVPVAVRPTRDERDIVIARKLFYAGLFFLPWLWAMCLLKMGLQRVWARDTHPGLRWYLRAQLLGLVVYLAAFVVWVVLFQTRWRTWGSFGSDLLIFHPDERWWFK